MKSTDRVIYPAVFTFEPGQEIAVTFPDLDVATSGVDERDALESARELLGVAIFGLEEDGEDIPKPSKLQAVKTKPNESVSLVDAYMPSVRLACSNKAVSRTVTLPAWLNALATANGVNFSQTLQNALRQQLNVN